MVAASFVVSWLDAHRNPQGVAFHDMAQNIRSTESLKEAQFVALGTELSVAMKKHLESSKSRVEVCCTSCLLPLPRLCFLTRVYFTEI